MNKQEYFRMYRVSKSHWWYVTRRDFIQTFLALIQHRKKQQILDIGCGTGANIKTLTALGAVTGIDISSYAKSLYLKNNNVFFQSGSAEKIPFANSQFDLVVLFDVLYHKHIVSPARALGEAHRVLKTGGYCLITDCVHPFLFGTHDRQNQARERFTKQKLEGLVRQEKFQVKRCSYIFMLTFPVFVIVRFLDKVMNPSVPIEEKLHVNINKFFLKVGSIENSILKSYNLPFGSSVILLAKKV